MVITIVCNPDGQTKFNDILHFVVNQGSDIDIPLKAKGVGETIYSKIPLDVINFGVQYTHRMVPREFFIENKGS